MSNQARRKEIKSQAVAVLEQTPQEKPQENFAANLLPELPDYLEQSCFKLTDDAPLGKHWKTRYLTAEEKMTFVRAYVSSGSIRKAAETSKIPVPTFYKHLQTDPDFQRAMTLAKLSMGDSLQATSYRRALEPNGVVDRMCQLKRFFPRIYRENSGITVNQVSVTNGFLR